ncbi:growth-regulating factor 5-like [Cynara cardunculus var. scolymus]|uniref:growth-regulating factor 5-like n=1 Tax=Cynara cardunculus var. scolymus TaxID=59895 RepID=UPI000D626633|nr:growth-regulating factor 5-like [Cynara cardunculus var. scolymus]
MSGSTTVAVAAAAAGSGISGYRPPFTPVQWQELEHQALIYKYLVAGVPVPYDLVVPIRRSLEALSASFFNHPTSLGYCSYYGKKFDPEPGRCRRTDGKKWRCSKDAYPDSKYCERHMHRGRNRSRKPVESQSASQSLSTAVSLVTTVSSTGSGNRSYQGLGSGSFQNSHLYPTASSGSFDFGGNVSKLQMNANTYGINNSFRYNQGLTADVDDRNYSSGASASARGGLGMESNADSSTWRLVPNQVPTTSLMESRNDSYLHTKSPQLTMVNAFEPVIDATTMSKPSQQHCLFGSKIGSPVEVKHEQHSMRPFFDEWPEAREPWSSLDPDSKNSFSTTQLSISTAPEYTARSDCTPNDG